MSEPEPSIFTLIIRGEIPCHKVYEDEHVFAFLDSNPFSPGHTLVVPKEQAITLDALSDESSAAIGRVLPRISRAVLAVSGTADFNVLQNNGEAAFQSVSHVHFHIIPKPEDGSGLAWPFKSTQLDPDEGARMAEQIRNYLE
ncbi:HIT family protein [Candidatus Thalassarchaeum betae]|mgnify:FL=1|uniref:HIT family protein n=1 Tax=Candidatus Thalassarchaeum betae TaxID=2599289 RepID=UPI0030C73B62|nr:HIT family protein [Candidatus Thalassoarchaea betae]